MVEREVDTTQEERINAALRLDALDLPSNPRIAGIDWEFYEDSSGDESLEIFVLLADDTTDKEIEKAPIHAIKRQIIESLREQKVTLFPYFTFRRESEHEPSEET
jgi:hypothetical protein